jgi:hypothetical protein
MDSSNVTHELNPALSINAIRDCNGQQFKNKNTGFKIAKKDGDLDKMKYYAEGIQKFERQLCLPVWLLRYFERRCKKRHRWSNNKTEGR